MHNLTKPSHLKDLCKKYNLSPSKKYGQNYLISEGVIDKIINATELQKSDTVIEIGPGFGVLTFALAEKVKKVIAFEIEQKLRDYWEENKQNNLEIVWGNALVQIKNQKSKIINDGKYKVVANIPYQITSNLLRVLLESENKPQSITVMVQKEVADRICAKPRSAGSGQAGEMSLLAVSVQYYGEPKIVARVSKGNFWPSPKVDSAVLHIITRVPEHQSTREFDKLFFKVVKAGFKNKRKQLWRNLSEGLKNVEGQVETCPHDIKKILFEVVGNEKVRAEELGVEEWENIVRDIYG
ncbi:ribosomal RNA small subunit methyltransferase A [Patescibacteria group bacterium]|nr:ribosomal RNA small subunit methyltransferase A [Patescibacteria group bacterium]